MDLFSKKGIIDNTVDIQTIRSHTELIRKREENTKLPEIINDDEESFDEVIGSGLTSESPSKVNTPRRKPKTVTKPTDDVKPKAKLKKKQSNAGKSKQKTEVNLENDETTQTVITQIEFLMPKTSQEFEKQLSNMKHIPQASKPPPARFKIPATLKLQTTSSVALPPLIANNVKTKQTLNHQFRAEYDKYSDKEFFKDFRFTFIPLPVPTEELPRK